MAPKIVKSVGVREAKAQLTKLLAQVERGACIDITSRGRHVARLVPAPQMTTSEARWKDLEARGLVTLATRPCPPNRKPYRPKKVPFDLQKMLRQDRDKY